MAAIGERFPCALLSQEEEAENLNRWVSRFAGMAGSYNRSYIPNRLKR